jgi:hypothetical protein
MAERTPAQRHARRLEVLTRRAEHLRERIESAPNRDLNFDKAERSAVLWAIEAINENERLRDLVRYSRHDLHDAELITDDEFAALLSVDGSVTRLENYDAMRATIEDLHAELKQLAPAEQSGERRPGN